MKIRNLIIYSAVLAAAAVVAAGCCRSTGTDEGNMANVPDEVVLRTIADRLCGIADLGFVDTKTGKEYTSTAEAPEGAELRFKNKYCNWHYTNGVLNIAMLHLSDFFDEPAYVDFVRDHISFGFGNYKYFETRYDPAVHGSHWRYPLGELYNVRELDDFGAMISSTLDLYNHGNGDKKMEYLEYAMMIGEFLKNDKLRDDDGTFVRSFPKQNTLWGDDLYMGVPLLVRLAAVTGDLAYLDDALLQVENFDRLLWDEKTDLYYHAYYTDTRQNGVAHWARCNGWLMFAKIELLKHIPSDHPKKQFVIDLLNKQIRGVARYQSPEGLWHQILDRNDSYLESSASAMYTYAVACGVNRGWVDKRYASIAITGWEGLKRYMLTASGDMKNICEGTEVHEDLLYYYTRPWGTNEKHGLGALIEAGIEVMKLKRDNAEIVEDVMIRVHLNNEEGFNI